MMKDDQSPGGERKRRKRRRVSKPGKPKITQKRPVLKEKEEIRLNRYIANAGICSRREADKLIESGKVKVNGEVTTALGTKVKRADKVVLDGKELSLNQKVYILLNKPKDFITTTNDPQGRKTVMDLIQDVDSERVYPVGRLDRNTTGLLLFTNDGLMAQRLTHPKHNIGKIYSVELDKPLAEKHRQLILRGIKLYDGVMKADKLAYVEDGNKKKLGIEIHSGKNRIIRRIFEKLEYDVVKLDRVLFAGLDKSGMKRGDWRKLTDKEVLKLKQSIGMA
jgi:23S rRNA pseudouridine2605 synthase